ncbi:hypothetical protein [Kocuria arenosa]|uniref:hypothetical protein n=1 Tax=Kocuria arenosa TaxID=3071446 RepID=UPI0034D5DF3E
MTLLIGVPLLVEAAVGWRRGSTRAGLVLLGALGYFLYVYAGCALGAIAYNELFLLYVVLFSAALYAFVLVFAALFRQEPARLFPPGTPQLGPAALMFASTVVLVVVWGPRWWRPRSPGWPRRGWARTPPSSPRPWIWQ